MNANRPTLPTLTVNRRFMMEFVAKEPPCLALGLVEVEGSQCAMITLRLNEALPREVSAAGFAFGHALYGGGNWEVVHSRSSPREGFPSQAICDKTSAIICLSRGVVTDRCRLGGARSAPRNF